MAKYYKHEELPIFKEALLLVNIVCEITKNREWNQELDLKKQLKRSIRSVPANIAEGFAKGRNAEFIRFLRIAKGSIGESRAHLRMAHDASLIEKKKFSELDSRMLKLDLDIGSFIRYLISFKKKYGIK